jgi:hypothetical protein
MFGVAAPRAAVGLLVRLTSKIRRIVSMLEMTLGRPTEKSQATPQSLSTGLGKSSARLTLVAVKKQETCRPFLI